MELAVRILSGYVRIPLVIGLPTMCLLEMRLKVVVPGELLTAGFAARDHPATEVRSLLMHGVLMSLAMLLTLESASFSRLLVNTAGPGTRILVLRNDRLAVQARLARLRLTPIGRLSLQQAFVSHLTSNQFWCGKSIKRTASVRRAVRLVL